MAIEVNSRSFWENYLLSAQLSAGEGLRSQAQLKTEAALATAHLRDAPAQEALLGQLNEEFQRAERDEAVFDAFDATERFSDELRPSVLNLETCALCDNVFVRYFRARWTLEVTHELHDVVDRLWSDPKTSDGFYGEMQAFLLRQLRADEMQVELAEKNAPLHRRYAVARKSWRCAAATLS
jgi:hypothetical protein